MHKAVAQGNSNAQGSVAQPPQLQNVCCRLLRSPRPRPRQLQVWRAELERYTQGTAFYLKNVRGMHNGPGSLPWRNFPAGCKVQWRRMADDTLVLVQVSEGGGGSRSSEAGAPACVYHVTMWRCAPRSGAPWAARGQGPLGNVRGTHMYS